MKLDFGFWEDQNLPKPLTPNSKPHDLKFFCLSSHHPSRFTLFFFEKKGVYVILLIIYISIYRLEGEQMKILKKERLKDCKNGAEKYILTFDNNITKDFLKSIKDKGKLTFQEDFDFPIYKMDSDDYMFRGKLESSDLKIWINHGSLEEAIDYFFKN